MGIKRFLEGVSKKIFLMLMVGVIMICESAPDFLTSIKPAVSFADMLEEGVELAPGDRVAGDVARYFKGYLTI